MHLLTRNDLVTSHIMMSEIKVHIFNRTNSQEEYLVWQLPLSVYATQTLAWQRFSIDWIEQCSVSGPSRDQNTKKKQDDFKKWRDKKWARQEIVH